MSVEYYKKYISSYFYYSTPLKGTKYLDALKNEGDLEAETIDLFEPNQYFSAYECARDFMVSVIHMNIARKSPEAVRILNVYKEAVANGVIEAANNVAILYHYFEYYDACEKYFRIAIEGGSYYASQNLAIYYCGEHRWDDFMTANLHSCAFNNPCSLFNLAISYHFGMHETRNIDMAIQVYQQILNLRCEDIKYNVEPTRDDVELLSKIQTRVVHNLALLYLTGRVADDLLLMYPEVGAKVEELQL